MNRRQNIGMSDITVSKSDLLEILRKNRDGHRETFDKAVEEFRSVSVKRLNAIVRQIKSGKMPNLYTLARLPVPEEHTADYDRAIRMMEMHTEENVSLNEQAYARLVDDEWDWRVSWMANTAMYLGGAQEDE